MEDEGRKQAREAHLNLQAELVGLRLTVLALVAREAMSHKEPNKVLAILKSDCERSVEDVTFRGNPDDVREVKQRASAFIRQLFGMIRIGKTN